MDGWEDFVYLVV